MPIQEILKANSAFVTKYRSLKPPPPNGWAIVTCSGRKLTGLVEAAMGFKPGESYILRQLGNTITPFDNSVIRSLSLLTATAGVKNVAVVGHTACHARMDTSGLLEDLQEAGVKREMAGGDLRSFFGILTDVRNNVRTTVDRIASSGLIPVGTRLFGFLINTDTAQLQFLCEHTVAPTDLPNIPDSRAYKADSDARFASTTYVEEVHGQKEVRQFKGSVKVPKEVRTSVKPVKVPQEVRSPVREVKVPTEVRSHKDRIEVPVKVKMPGKRVDPGRVGEELEGPLEDTGHKAERRRDLDLLREQAGHRAPPRKPKIRPVLEDRADAGRVRPRRQRREMDLKYCPRCGAEYFPHIEECADCRIKLVSTAALREAKDELRRDRGGKPRRKPRGKKYWRR